MELLRLWSSSESKEMLGRLRMWILLDGIYNAAIFMMLIPLCDLWMEAA
jgi:hypothetical protein